MTFAELLVSGGGGSGDTGACRFTTSHPRDFGRDIVEAIDSVPRCAITCTCRLQSGSTRVLRAMQRTYTRDEYLEKIALIRSARRSISVTSGHHRGISRGTEEDVAENSFAAWRLRNTMEFCVPVFAPAEHGVIADDVGSHADRAARRADQRNLL